MSLLIRPGWVVTPGEGGVQVLRGVEVEVEGGKIVRVGPAAESASFPQPLSGQTSEPSPPGGPGEAEAAGGREIISDPEAILIPGLVNAHCHAAMTLLRGYADDLPLMPWLREKIWPVEARLGPEDVYWGTLLACLEMLRAGVTSFADMYFFMEEAARACLESGIRASLSVGLIAGDEEGRVLPQAEEKLLRAVEFCRRWEGEGGGRITTMLGPHAPYTCPPDFLRQVLLAARELGVGIHIHLSETEEEVELSRARYGRSPVELLHELGYGEAPLVLAAHCVHVDPKDRELLACLPGGVAHNPRSNSKLASGIAPVVEMLEAGVNVSLGTDGPASTNQLGLFEEMRQACYLQKLRLKRADALSAAQVLEMATRGGARVMGRGGRAGEIAPGRDADLVLLKPREPRLFPRHDLVSLVVYSCQDGDVDTVVVGGEVVMRGREMRRLDEERVLHEAQRRARQLVAG